MRARNHTTPDGHTLIELLVYLSLMVILSTALVGASVSLLSTFAQLSAGETIAQSATVAMERMVREVQRSHAIDVFDSTLNTHPGRLALTTVDLSESPTTIVFSLQGDTLMIESGGGGALPLTTSSVDVTNMVFTRMINAETEGVLIEMTLETTVRGTTRSESFRTFAVLDNS